MKFNFILGASIWYTSAEHTHYISKIYGIKKKTYFIKRLKSNEQKNNLNITNASILRLFLTSIVILY